MNALDLVLIVYPLLIAAGCIAHLSDLVIEDIFKIPEAKQLMNKVKFVAVFVRSHRRVKNLYLQVCKIPRLGGGPVGTMLKLFPETRFSYGDLMIQQFLDNKYYLEQTILHEDFEEVCESITDRKVNEFKDIVQPSIVSNNRYFDHKFCFFTI